MRYLVLFLTISRFFSPILILFLQHFEPKLYIISFLLLLLSMFSDFLDGFLSRRNKCTSRSGAVLDFMADKYFVTTMFIFFIWNGNIKSIYEIFAIFMIILREFLVISMRLFFNTIEVSNSGKFKAVLQFTTLLLYMISLRFQYFLLIAKISLFFSTILSVYSLRKYFIHWKKIS